ncbi:hypothetical protein [Rhodopirellula europaea]|uniref:hypothetical protein n=1 Tax=Rhodopirellula europaea TaxID=1263866 RepID=UPI001181B64F|nr:hypothetical protein [Rhodopirellula europaea]
MTQASSSWFRRIEWTKVATWFTFFYVFVVKGDELVSLADRWFFASNGLTVSTFTHESFVNPPSQFYPSDPDGDGSDPLKNTDRVEIGLKLLNNTNHTILVERAEFDFRAEGTVPKGVAQTSKLELNGEYAISVPDLQPNEEATRYVTTPHVLKPNDADHFIISLVWPRHVGISGTYTIATRLVTSDGIHNLEEFDVPVLSDRVLVHPARND